jgi:hypothetical protein
VESTEDGVPTGYWDGTANVSATHGVSQRPFHPDIFFGWALLTSRSANYFFYYGTVVFRGTGINNSFVTQMILVGFLIFVRSELLLKMLNVCRTESTSA